MRYTLMNKNTPILDLDIVRGIITDVFDIYNSDFLPVGSNLKNEKDRNISLMEWWYARNIPPSRDNIMNVIEYLNITFGYPGNLFFLSEKCFGLSLSDQYWINPCDSPLKWSDINFFENDFSEDMGKMLFDDIQADNPNLISPDNTSDGNLIKKWKVIDGERFLIKGSSMQNVQEPFNEEAASVICEALNIENYVPYETKTETPECPKPICACKNFVTTDTEFVNAWSLIRNDRRDDNTSIYDNYVKICKNVGIDDISDRLDEMITLDYLIANTDRHFRNFGLIRNVETLEFEKAAPIFDNGTSMQCHKMNENIFHKDNEYKLRSKPFKTTHYEQIKLVKCPERFEIDKIRHIADKIRSVYEKDSFISPMRAELLCQFFNERITCLDRAFSRRKSFVPVEKPTGHNGSV